MHLSFYMHALKLIASATASIPLAINHLYIISLVQLYTNDYHPMVPRLMFLLNLTGLQQDTVPLKVLFFIFLYLVSFGQIYFSSESADHIV